GAIRGRIEEKIRQGVTGQMVGMRHFWRYDKPFRGNAAILSVSLQPGIGVLPAVEEPQHAVRHALENGHPAIEVETSDLLCAVEAAIDECVFRQPGVAA